MNDDPAKRVCPGRHAPDRPAPALRPDEYLCKRCVDRAFGYLVDMYDDVDQLELTINRQAKGGQIVGSARRKGDELPLPFNAKAAEVSADVRDRLWEWAQMIDPSIIPSTMRRSDRDPDALADATSRYRRSREGLTKSVETLLDHRNFLRADEQGPGLANTIAHCRGRLRAHFDRRDQRWFAGQCGAAVLVLELAQADEHTLTTDAHSSTCDLALFAKPGETEVVCDGYHDRWNRPGCSAAHSAQSRKAYQIEALQDLLLPLDVILPALPGLIGRNPNDSTVRMWRHSRRLVARDERGDVKLYRGGDVIALALDRDTRPGPKRRDKPVRHSSRSA